MFVDQAKVYVKGGDGGDGVVAFRREIYVPEGGPAGGDGGKGGNVIFRVDEGLRTLMDFRYQRHFKAKPGVKGRNKSMHGANAEDLVVRVPPGTLVIDDDTKMVIADLVRHEQEAIIARGGKGGRGNTRFASSSNTAPEIAENGEEGEERWVVLELKVMADIGLVGFPSVGKSTLLSVISAAKPKIGAYHFTTLTPNLGVVDVGDGRSFVMADLPGLIEGAHEGTGLGHEFLRHTERTRIIIHVVDMSASEGRDPFEDWQAINQELVLYNTRLEERPQIIAANKMDLPEAKEHLELFREKMKQSGHNVEIFPISSATREGVKELIFRAADLLDEIGDTPLVTEVEENERVVYKLDEKEDQTIRIRRENDLFIVENERIEKMLKRMNMDSYDAIMRFARIMRKMGVDNELRKKGAKDGHYIRIGEFEFEFVEKE
ncbi:MAG: GTPase ObgE [Paenibacillus sp. RIFOXYA1_FULL_44_5]|nr:MAG: GTPase ObgE [Paenibacillus sp. RIFOXYA1_FULL_44_5]